MFPPWDHSSPSVGIKVDQGDWSLDSGQDHGPVPLIHLFSSLLQEARENMATIIIREHLQIISTFIFFISDALLV